MELLSYGYEGSNAFEVAERVNLKCVWNVMLTRIE